MNELRERAAEIIEGLDAEQLQILMEIAGVLKRTKEGFENGEHEAE